VVYLEQLDAVYQQQQQQQQPSTVVYQPPDTVDLK